MDIKPNHDIITKFYADKNEKKDKVLTYLITLLLSLALLIWIATLLMENATAHVEAHTLQVQIRVNNTMHK